MSEFVYTKARVTEINLHSFFSDQISAKKEFVHFFFRSYLPNELLRYFIKCIAERNVNDARVFFFGWLCATETFLHTIGEPIKAAASNRDKIIKNYMIYLCDTIVFPNRISKKMNTHTSYFLCKTKFYNLWQIIHERKGRGPFTENRAYQKTLPLTTLRFFDLNHFFYAKIPHTYTKIFLGDAFRNERIWFRAICIIHIGESRDRLPLLPDAARNLFEYYIQIEQFASISRARSPSAIDDFINQIGPMYYIMRLERILVKVRILAQKAVNQFVVFANADSQSRF